MTAAAGAGVLRVERVERTLVMTLDRPEAANAVDARLAVAIAAALDELDADPHLRVGVIAAAGPRFCGGMDLKEASRTGKRPIVPGRGFAGIVEQPSRKPLVAAVDGPAAGGGCEIALACDLVVAGEGATFALPEVRVGLVPGGGGMFRLPARVGPAVAAEMVLTGGPIGARRAHEVGLVNRLVSAGSALDEAHALAVEVAANAPVAVQVATEVLRQARGSGDASWWERQRPFVERVRATDDAVEGPRSFVEKRAPRWTG